MLDMPTSKPPPHDISPEVLAKCIKIIKRKIKQYEFLLSNEELDTIYWILSLVKHGE